MDNPNESDEDAGSAILPENTVKAKSLKQSKNAFLAIAAHEMRTPLVIIRGNTELLLDEPAIATNPELRTKIENILRSTIRLSNIVNDFLDVKNLEGKRLPLSIEPIDVVPFLTESVRDLSGFAEKKGLTLTLNIPPDLGAPVLDLDRYRLQQIVANIVSNAIHYTEKGGVTVTPRRDEKGVRIFFEDTGVGISSEERARLFKKLKIDQVFMRGEGNGSGMGLYISRFLAHLMGGDLVLEKSEVGKGSVFCLTLPLGNIPKK